jgi:hypothetical protein
LVFLTSFDPRKILDSGVMSTPVSSSIVRNSLKLSGKDSLERVRSPLELDATRSCHSGCLSRSVT